MGHKDDQPIEPDDPIIIPKPKGKGVIEPRDKKETHWERLELERRLNK